MDRTGSSSGRRGGVVPPGVVQPGVAPPGVVPPGAGAVPVDDDAAARLRRRYPRPRLPRPLLIGLIGLVAAIALGWLVWTATVRSQPPVTARVSTFTVPSDRRVDVVVTVQRTDPARRAACRVQAQAADRSPVGEQVVDVPPASTKLVEVTLSLTTLRRAVAASVSGCAVI